jgi:hypothetical protein
VDMSDDDVLRVFAAWEWRFGVCWWSYLCGLCSNEIYDECLSTEHSHRTNVALGNDGE